MTNVAWQTPVVIILLMIQFAIGQALGAEPGSGIVLGPWWKIVVLPSILVGVGYSLNQLKPIGAQAVVRAIFWGTIIGGTIFNAGTALGAF